MRPIVNMKLLIKVSMFKVNCVVPSVAKFICGVILILLWVPMVELLYSLWFLLAFRSPLLNWVANVLLVWEKNTLVHKLWRLFPFYFLFWFFNTIISIKRNSSMTLYAVVASMFLFYNRSKMETCCLCRNLFVILTR